MKKSELRRLIREEIQKMKLTESKFKVDDLVYHKKHKSVGIVRDIFDKDGDVRTDADGLVRMSDIELFDPFNKKNHTTAKVAPSTQKEVSDRGLWNPWKKK